MFLVIKSILSKLSKVTFIRRRVFTSRRSYYLLLSAIPQIATSQARAWLLRSHIRSVCSARSKNMPSPSLASSSNKDHNDDAAPSPSGDADEDSRSIQHHQQSTTSQIPTYPQSQHVRDLPILGRKHFDTRHVLHARAGPLSPLKNNRLDRHCIDLHWRVAMGTICRL